MGGRVLGGAQGDERGVTELQVLFARRGGGGEGRRRTKC